VCSIQKEKKAEQEKEPRKEAVETKLQLAMRTLLSASRERRFFKFE